MMKECVNSKDSLERVKKKLNNSLVTATDIAQEYKMGVGTCIKKLQEYNITPIKIFGNVKVYYRPEIMLHKEAFENCHKGSCWESEKSKLAKRQLQELVLGVDKRIDYREKGFIVNVSLRSATYKEQVAFVKGHKRDIYEYVMEELRSNTNLINKIGSLNYYELSNVTVTRDSRIVFLYDIKKEIEDLLNEN